LHQRVAVLPLRGGGVPRSATNHSARAVRGGQGGRGGGVGTLRARDPAPDAQRALRHRAAAVDLHVHQVRHGVAHGGRGRGGARYMRTLPVYAYARSFTYLQAGMGAALAVIMFAMLLVISAVYFRLLRDEESTA